MAWRKPVDPPHIEAPEWYRNYHPESWEVPDGSEQAMISGWFPGEPWPPELHAAHSERRWQEAKHAYRREHPALAEQEFLELVSGERRARESERRDQRPSTST